MAQGLVIKARTCINFMVNPGPPITLTPPGFLQPLGGGGDASDTVIDVGIIGIGTYTGWVEKVLEFFTEQATFSDLPIFQFVVTDQVILNTDSLFRAGLHDVKSFFALWNNIISILQMYSMPFGYQG